MEPTRDLVSASWGSSGGAWSILVHGGAGDVPVNERADHAEGCRLAADAGAAILRAGGTAADAVQRAVELLEDDPRFNAGTGGCLTDAGTLELDAAIMTGHDLRVGGVCMLPPFRHPIAIARTLLEKGEPVLLAGAGAERFALAHGFERVADDAMITEGARLRLQATRARLGHPGAEVMGGGTVGAVARDGHGHTAAATSTGGRVNKPRGRVGDSPIPGAGTYADDAFGACSCTGTGEAILRVVLATFTLNHVRGAGPEAAARLGIERLVTAGRGNGGLILVDPGGNLGFARGTATMSWAAAGASLEPTGGF